MKVTVKNLGILRQAEFSLGDLTIICGRNNTGKTYATYALYGFLEEWRRNIHLIKSAQIPIQVIRDLMNDGIVRIDLLDYAQKTGAILQEMCELYTQNLSRIFAASEDRFRDSSFRVSLDERQIRESIKPLSFESKTGTPNRQIFSLSKVTGNTELEVSLLVSKQNSKNLSGMIRTSITETINRIIFDQFFPTPFTSSAERTGAAIFRKELNFARNRLLKEMSRADDTLDPRELLFKSYQSYARPVEDDVEFTRRLESVAKKKNFLAAENPQILKRFADIIGGSYRVTRNDELYFVPKGAQVKLSMDESSSGVRSMLGIGFYLRHEAKPGDLLMVDEPELNLHPEKKSSSPHTATISSRS